MESINRKPFQGVRNIVRFNWHFYIVASAVIGILIILKGFVPLYVSSIILFFVLLVSGAIFLSLLVSFYVYDCSGLYRLNWLNFLSVPPGAQLVTINAGFDETSYLLSQKFPESNLLVLDFYDANKHTEISIERARQAYPLFTGTKRVSTSNLPLAPSTIDCIFIVLAAHEIRNTQERILFFKQLKESLKKEGKIVVVEHLRDWKNFLAYNFGFFHFISRNEWKHNFNEAGLILTKEKKITPFISVFILQKNGTTP